MKEAEWSAIAKQKYYVVWAGREPGIYNTWNECRTQTDGFPGARFKSFPSLAEAKAAFASGSTAQRRQQSAERKLTGSGDTKYVEKSVSVDAACSGNPGPMEYRGVDTKTGEELFHVGPVPNGTNNIGEFLAIVHALALLKKENSELPIYSDSQIALGWVRKKQLNTTVPRDESTKEVWDLIDRATVWLRNNSYSNELYKWDTVNWGEIKADFGRK